MRLGASSKPQASRASEVEGYIDEARTIQVVFNSKRPQILYMAYAKTLAIHITSSYKSPYFKQDIQRALQCVRVMGKGASLAANTVGFLILSLLSAFLGSLGSSSLSATLLLVVIVVGLLAGFYVSWYRGRCRGESMIVYVDVPRVEEIVGRAASILQACRHTGRCSGYIEVDGVKIFYKARIGRFTSPRVTFTRSPVGVKRPGFRLGRPFRGE
ncbi:MAG: hypothetical protein GSR73_01330 [Desulfurococcales archaeon]|nr:hypothetical protein [Desulfurococcales archaeon]